MRWMPRPRRRPLLPPRRRPGPRAWLRAAARRASRYHQADAALRPRGRPGTSRLRAPGVTGRILGIDLGSRRVGLAVADSGIGIARALATVGRGATPDADAA